MQYIADADISLFAVRYKLEKEYRAYLFLRDLAKDRSGYVNRKNAASELSAKCYQGYSTSQRHIKTLVEMGWVTPVRKGNIHVNGIYRVKALLQKHIEGFQIRKRVFTTAKPKFLAGSRKGLINAFKANLCSGLTWDKVRRNETRYVKNLPPQERKNKAVLGTALAKAPHLRQYAYSLKSEDWHMSPATVFARKSYAETDRLEWYRWISLGDKVFRSEREAVQFGNAHLRDFNRGYLKKRGNAYLVCTGETVHKGSNSVHLGFRRSLSPKRDMLNIKIAGQQIVLKAEKIKPLKTKTTQKIFVQTDFRAFTEVNEVFSFDPFQSLDT